MALQVGNRLGSFEILSLLGSGGMGEVYRAKDSRLQREIAIKALPDAFAHDSERVARFQREAQILGSLNHPNIAVIYDIQEAEGARYLVLELVEGETLADRLKRGPLPVDEALDVVRQVADALEAAHEKGVLHRDLKPANIQITPEGRVKVLDFGLAKMMDPAPSDAAGGPADAMSQSPTMMSGVHTGGGVILGTAAYMSPEQARGRTVDRRTDIWALGCVLFEALTAQKAFKGEDVTEMLAAIIKGQPDWTLLPPDTPGIIRSLLRQCLQKQSRQRLREAGDARIALEDAIAHPESGPVRPTTMPPPRIPWKWMVPFLAAAMLVGALAVWGLRPAPTVDRPVTHLLLTAQPAERLVGNFNRNRPTRTAMALSPDGRTVVFSGIRGTVGQLFKRALNESDAAPMAGTEGGNGPFFSPNGQWVGFWADNKLKKTALAGGPPVVICPAPAAGGLFGASWGPDDTIVFSMRGEGISKVSAGGGTPAAVTKADASKSEAFHILPQVLPGGKTILYTVVVTPNDWEQTTIVAQSMDTGERRVLIQGGADARYVPTGHLVYMKQSTLMAVPFDPGRVNLTGAPVAILDNVMQGVNALDPRDETGAGQFSVSASGILMYVLGGIFPEIQREFVWVDRQGVATPLPIPPGNYYTPRVSPNGERIAFAARRKQTRESDLWVYDISRQNTTRLTSQGDYTNPVWSPDSKNLVFKTLLSGFFNLARMSADGSGSPERLATSKYDQIPSSWSPLSNMMAFGETHGPAGQIWVLPMDGPHEPKFLQEVPVNVSPQPALSPDGRWLAYDSRETGNREVYAQPYPGPGQKIRISTDGGQSAVWARNGRELFYMRVAAVGTWQVMVVDIDTANGIRASKPRVLFDGPYQANPFSAEYDVTPDGQRFIMSKATYFDTPATEIHVILNWTEELKRRVPAK